MTGHCHACLFWDPNSGHARGLCRYAAPRTHAVGIGGEIEIRAVWPETSPGDWCGRYMPDVDPSPRSLGR